MAKCIPAAQRQGTGAVKLNTPSPQSWERESRDRTGRTPSPRSISNRMEVVEYVLCDSQQEYSRRDDMPRRMLSLTRLLHLHTDQSPPMLLRLFKVCVIPKELSAMLCSEYPICQQIRFCEDPPSVKMVTGHPSTLPKRRCVACGISPKDVLPDVVRSTPCAVTVTQSGFV